MPKDPNNPQQPSQLPSQGQQATPLNVGVSVEYLTQLEEAKKRTGDLTSAYQKSVEAGNAYVKNLLEQAQELESLKAKYDTLSTKSELYAKSLETQIDKLREASSVINGELNNSISETIKNNEKYEKTITALNGVLGEQIETFEDLQKLVIDLDQNFSTLVDAMPTLEDQGKLVEVIASLNDEMLNGNELTEDSIKLAIEAKGLSIDEAAAREVTTNLLSKQAAQTAIRIRQEEERNKQRREELAQQLAINDLEQKRANGLKNVNESMSALADKMLGSSKNTNFLTSAIMGASKGFGDLATSMLTGFMSSIFSVEGALNRFFGFLNRNLIQSTFEFDKILTEVNKKTGGMGKEFEQIGINKAGLFAASTVSGLAEYGVGLKEVGDAYASLSSKVNGFNDLSEKQRKILATTAATMETLGVSSQTYAELTSKFMGSLGKTVEGTRDTINGLAKDAIAAGRSVGEYTKEFEQLMPKIIGFGREATTIFKELNAVSAMTKGVMSAGDLQNFAAQFDNWDSAAEAVSKLNAGLGGTSLNIQDLMRADPSEKLMMLKRTFDESGQDFDKLNIGYKRLLAEAFGGDVAKAASFFKGDLAEANRMMHEQAATEKELEERKKKSVEATQKLEKALEGVKIAFTPIIDAIAMVAGWIAKLNDKIGGFGTFLVGLAAVGIPAVIAGFKLFSMAANSSFGGVARNILQWMGSIRKEIAEAKKEAAEIPSATKGGGGGDIASSVVDADASGAKGGKSTFGKSFKGGFSEAWKGGGGLKGMLMTTAISLASAGIGAALTSQTSNNTEQDIKSSNIDSSTNYHNDGRTFLTKNGKVESVFSEGDMVFAAGAKTPDGLRNVVYGKNTSKTSESSDSSHITSTLSDTNRAEAIYKIIENNKSERSTKEQKNDETFKEMNEQLKKLVKKDTSVHLAMDGKEIARQIAPDIAEISRAKV